MTPKVSVIIAVYKVEDYIERCLHSLFGQTLDSIEYIFVDDASPDSSIKIIEKILELYPLRKSQVKIIRHSENQGVALARTSGILAATGEYMIHCDPDDYVEPDMYEEMYKNATINEVEVVFCDYIRHNDKTIYPVYLNLQTNSLKKMKISLYNGLFFSLWNVLVKTTLINNNVILPYPGGDIGEDSALIFRILYFTQSVSYIPRTFYHYCQRNNSIITGMKMTDKIRKLQINIEGLSNFFSGEKKYQKYCDFIKLNVKFKYKDAFKGKEKEWFKFYSESHSRMIFHPVEKLKVRILWATLLSNYYAYKWGSYLYYFIMGKSL